MKEPLFAKERVMFDRRPELDFAKGICILGMILVHCYENIWGTWDTGLGTSIVEYLGYPVGAPLFMVCMGMTIIFSRRNSTMGFFVRGVVIFIAGVALNVIRQGFVYFVCYSITGDIFFAIQYIVIFGVDILQFAGLAFLLLALLSKLKVKPLGVLVVGVVLNIVGMLLEGLQCGIYPVDQLFGFFWGTETEAYFPFFNWFIFVAAGYAYGHYYVRINDLKRWNTIVLPVGIVLTIVFYYISICVDQDFLRMFNSFNGFNNINIFDAIVCLVVCVTFIGLLWCVSRTGLKLKGLVYMSKNINKYYCVSYVLIYVFMALYELDVLLLESDLSMVICSIVVLAAATGCIMFYKKYMEKKVGPWFRKHLVLVSIVVLVAGAGFTIAGFNYCAEATEMCKDPLMYIEYELEDYDVEFGDDLYPNMYNNYLGY